MSGNIDLLLPGLFDLPNARAEDLERLPALARLLRYARPLANDAHSIDANIAAILRLPRAERGSFGLPLAWVFGETGDDGAALLFEPVHLRPDMQQALLLPVGRAPADLDDTRRLVADLVREFADDFACVEVEPGVYRMRLRRVRPPQHYPHPLSVLGKPAGAHVERGRAHLDWYRLQTEVQMFLHRHAVNGERLGRGALPINSLWCWGAGRLDAKPGRRPAWICADPLLRRFGERLGLETGDAAALAAVDGDLAVIDLRLLEWLKTGVDVDLASLLADLDAMLLHPLLERIEQRRMRLRLRAASEKDYRLGPGSLRCFWRPARRAAVRWSGTRD